MALALNLPRRYLVTHNRVCQWRKVHATSSAHAATVYLSCFVDPKHEPVGSVHVAFGLETLGFHYEIAQ